MQNWMGLFLMAPSFVFLMFSGGLGIAGYSQYQRETARDAAIEAMITQGPPEVREITEFKRDRKAPDPQEIQVRGKLAFAYNTQLITKSEDATVADRAMYILVDPAAEPGKERALAAVVLPTKDKERFALSLMAQSEQPDASGVVTIISGIVTQDEYAGQVRSSLSKQKLGTSRDFVIISPFLNGRDQDLRAYNEAKPDFSMPILLGAAFFLLVGLGKWAFEWETNRRAPKKMDLQVWAIPKSPIASAVNPESGEAVLSPAQARRALAKGGYEGLSRRGSISHFQIAFVVVAVAVAGLIATGQTQYLSLIPLAVVLYGWVVFIMYRRAEKRRASDPGFGGMRDFPSASTFGGDNPSQNAPGVRFVSDPVREARVNGLIDDPIKPVRRGLFGSKKVL